MNNLEELKQAIQKRIEKLKHVIAPKWLHELEIQQLTWVLRELDGLVAKEVSLPKEPSLRKRTIDILDSFKGLIWGERFYKELGYRITDDEEDEIVLTKAMDSIIEQLKKAVGEEEDTTVSHRLIRTCCSKHNEEGDPPK